MDNKYLIKKIYSNYNKYLIIFYDTFNNHKYKIEFSREKNGFIGFIPNDINKSLFYYTLFKYNNRLVNIIPEEYITFEMAIICACDKYLKIPSKYDNIKELHNLRYIKTMDDDMYDEKEISNILNIQKYISFIEEKYFNIINSERNKIFSEENELINNKIIKLDKIISSEVLEIERMKKEKEHLINYLNNYNNTRKYIKLKR